MRKSFGAKPMLFPQAVLIVGADGQDGTLDYRKLRTITFDPARESYIALWENVSLAFQIGNTLKKILKFDNKS